MASAFTDYQNDDRFVIFASGVSDSSETDCNKFLREENLLNKTLRENRHKHIIYFSSFIDQSKKPYIEHKERMEDIIEFSNVPYTIIKLPQAVGRGGNPNNLFNYFVNNIRDGKEINVYHNTFRSLIDVDDIKKIVDTLINNSRYKNEYIVFPYIEKMYVMHIVHLISKALGIEPRINLIDAEPFDFPKRTYLVKYVLRYLNISPEGYTERVINKYVR